MWRLIWRVHWEKVKQTFFFFTALVSHWLLLLRFKCNAARRELNSRFFHFTMPDRRHQTKHLNVFLFSGCVNITFRNIFDKRILCENKPLFFFFKLIKSGFWSLVSVFGCFWCVFFFFFFISCVNTVIPGVCSVKAVNRSLHLCIWKVSLLKYFCVFYYFWVFFSKFSPWFSKK